LNPKPTTTLLLFNDKRELLLTKRKKAPNKGKWGTPGGFVNIHETAEGGIRREIKEELGITLGTVHYLSTYTFPYRFEGEPFELLEVAFYSYYKKGNIRPSDDIAEAVFVPLAKIDYAKIAFPSTKQAIQLLMKIIDKI